MDVLRDYYHTEIENEILEIDSEEEEQSYIASPMRNKRRKVTPEKPQARKIETRSAKRQAVKEEPPIHQKGDQHGLLIAEGEVKSHSSRAKVPTGLLPPKTPMSSRRKEIPSSQSPADTPLSMHSRQSPQQYTRSPLKERSTNIDLPIKSHQKGALWSKTLEVADSMETEVEDSPVSEKVDYTTEAVDVDSHDTVDKEPQIPFDAFAIHVDDFNQRLKAAQRPVREIQNSGRARSRLEVIDSTDEEDDDEDAQAFNAGLETQAALTSTDVSQKSSDQLPETTPLTSKPAENEHQNQRNGSESPKALKAPPLLIRESEFENQLPVQRPKKVDFINLPSSDPSNSPKSSPLTRRPSDDSEEVSAQLLADLDRDAQPCGLQTESQFENGWTTYTPAAEEEEDDDVHSGSDIEPLPPSSSPSKPVIEEAQPHSSALMTVPTQLIRPPFSSPPLFYKAPPVPPSQATTVDVTQPSPLPLPHTTHNITSSPHRSSPQQCKLPPNPTSSQTQPPSSSSSPPPIPPPSSSSPLAVGRKWKSPVDPWEGYKWNGRRLTDSQLLPESLLYDESQGGPPPLLLAGGLSQECWEEEVEEV